MDSLELWKFMNELAFKFGFSAKGTCTGFLFLDLIDVSYLFPVVFSYKKFSFRFCDYYTRNSTAVATRPFIYGEVDLADPAMFEQFDKLASECHKLAAGHYNSLEC